MMYPECSYHFHPRNKNMVLGAIIEAIYYSQINKGRPDPSILAELRAMMEHCTGCGRCTSVCPVKIPSADVALQLRAFLDEEGAGGHPLKSKVLNWLVRDRAPYPSGCQGGGAGPEDAEQDYRRCAAGHQEAFV